MLFIYGHLCMEDAKAIKDTTTKNRIDEELMGGKIQVFEK